MPEIAHTPFFDLRAEQPHVLINDSEDFVPIGNDIRELSEPEKILEGRPIDNEEESPLFSTPTPGATETFLKSAKRQVIPTAAGIGAGLLASALLPVGAPLALAIGVPLIAGTAAGTAASFGQEALSPTTPEEASEIEQMRAEHPLASALGDVAPSLLAFRTQNPAKLYKLFDVLRKNAAMGVELPPIGRSLLAEAGIGAATSGLVPIATGLVQGEMPNKEELLTGIVAGGLLTRPNYFTRAVTGAIGGAAKSAAAKFSPKYAEALPGKALGVDILNADLILKELNNSVLVGKKPEPLFKNEYELFGVIPRNAKVEIRENDGTVRKTTASDVMLYDTKSEIMFEFGKEALKSAIYNEDEDLALKTIRLVGGNPRAASILLPLMKEGSASKEMLRRYIDTNGTDTVAAKYLNERLAKAKALTDQEDIFVPLDKEGKVAVDDIIVADAAVSKFSKTKRIDEGVVNSIKSIENPILKKATINLLYKKGLEENVPNVENEKIKVLALNGDLKLTPAQEFSILMGEKPEVVGNLISGIDVKTLELILFSPERSNEEKTAYAIRYLLSQNKNALGNLLKNKGKFEPISKPTKEFETPDKYRAYNAVLSYLSEQIKKGVVNEDIIKSINRLVNDPVTVINESIFLNGLLSPISRNGFNKENIGILNYAISGNKAIKNEKIKDLLNLDFSIKKEIAYNIENDPNYLGENVIKTAYFLKSASRKIGDVKLSAHSTEINNLYISRNFLRKQIEILNNTIQKDDPRYEQLLKIYKKTLIKVEKKLADRIERYTLPLFKRLLSDWMASRLGFDANVLDFRTVKDAELIPEPFIELAVTLHEINSHKNNYSYDDSLKFFERITTGTPENDVERVAQLLYKTLYDPETLSAINDKDNVIGTRHYIDYESIKKQRLWESSFEKIDKNEFEEVSEGTKSSGNPMKLISESRIKSMANNLSKNATSHGEKKLYYDEETMTFSEKQNETYSPIDFKLEKVITVDSRNELPSGESYDSLRRELAKKGVEAIFIKNENSYDILKPYSTSNLKTIEHNKALVVEALNKAEEKYNDTISKIKTDKAKEEAFKQYTDKINEIRRGLIPKDIPLSEYSSVFNMMHEEIIGNAIRSAGSLSSDAIKNIIDVVPLSGLTSVGSTFHSSKGFESEKNTLRKKWEHTEFKESLETIIKFLESDNVPDNLKRVVCAHALEFSVKEGECLVWIFKNNLPASFTVLGQYEEVSKFLAQKGLGLRFVFTNKYGGAYSAHGDVKHILMAFSSFSSVLGHEMGHAFMDHFFAKKKTPFEKLLFDGYMKVAEREYEGAKLAASKTGEKEPYLAEKEPPYSWDSEVHSTLLGPEIFKRLFRGSVDTLSHDYASYKRIINGTATGEDYLAVMARKAVYSLEKYASTARADDAYYEARLSYIFRKEDYETVRRFCEYNGIIPDFTNEQKYFSGYITRSAGVDVARNSARIIDDILLSRKLYDTDGGHLYNWFLKMPKLRSLLNYIKDEYGIFGKYIAIKAERFFETRDALIGRFYNDTILATQNLSYKDREFLSKILRDERESGTSLENNVPLHLKPTYHVIRNTLSEIAAHHEAYNMPIWEYEGGKPVRVRKMIEYKYYFPDIIDSKVIDILVNKPNTPEWERLKKDFIDYTVEKMKLRGVSEEEAREKARQTFAKIVQSSATGQRLVRGITGEYGPLRVEMGVGLPESWRSKDVSEIMSRYIMRVCHDMALHNAIQIDPIARIILGIEADPFDVKTMTAEEAEARLNTLSTEININIHNKLLDVYNALKNNDIQEARNILNSIEISDNVRQLSDVIVQTVENIKKIVNSEPKFINKDILNVNIGTISSIAEYLKDMSTEFGKNKENASLNTPEIQQLMKILYRDISNSEMTFHAASSLVKSMIIGVKSKVRDVFNNTAIFVGYSEVPIKNLPTIALSAAKFVADGSAFENAIRLGFIRRSSSSVQEFNLMIGGDVNSFARKLLWLRDLALSATKTDRLEEFSRVLSYALSEAAVRYHIINSRGTGRQASISRKFLEHFTKKAYVEGKYADDEIAQAAVRLAQTAQGTYDARDLPAWMLENSFTAAVFTLSKWTIGQTNRFITNIGKFGAQTALKLMFGSIIGGIAGVELMEFLFGRRSNTAKLEELIKTPEKERLASESLYTLTSLLQWSGYAGILMDMVKIAQDALKGQQPQGYQSPLYEQMVSFIDSTMDMINSIYNGEDAIDVTTAYIADTLRTQVQTLSGLYAFGAVNSTARQGIFEEERERIEIANLRTLYGLYKRLSGDTIQKGIPSSGSRYYGIGAKKFRMANTPQEMIENLPSAMNYATKKALRTGDINEVGRSLLYSDKTWSPTLNPFSEEPSLQTMRYWNWLNTTTEPRERDKYYKRLVETSLLNELKRGMVNR